MSDAIEQSGVEETAIAAESQEIETNEAGEQASEGTERVDAAFAKRLAAERAKIEQEYTDRYKDYDTYKSISGYFSELNEIEDINELNERIELERLQQRAEYSQVTPEVQRRLEELEAKAAEADQLREQQTLQSWYKDFRTDLEKFAAEKQINADEIEKFMTENKVGSFEIAYKAIKFADAEAKKEEIEKAAIARYLDSKKSPNVLGSGGVAHVAPSTPKTWQEARAGALEMMRNANKNA